jgi:hypothetical protein
VATQDNVAQNPVNAANQTNLNVNLQSVPNVSTAAYDFFLFDMHDN